jgi:hypothetical protein
MKEIGDHESQNRKKNVTSHIYFFWQKRNGEAATIREKNRQCQQVEIWRRMIPK